MAMQSPSRKIHPASRQGLSSGSDPTDSTGTDAPLVECACLMRDSVHPAGVTAGVDGLHSGCTGQPSRSGGRPGPGGPAGHEARSRNRPPGVPSLGVVVHQLETGGHRPPPRRVPEHPRPELGAQRPEHHPPGRRLVGQLPAELGGEAQPRLVVGQATRAWSCSAGSPRRPPRSRRCAIPGSSRCSGRGATRGVHWLPGSTARPPRLVGTSPERHPTGEHVLGRPEVLVHEIAGVSGHERRRVDDARDLQRVAERPGSHDAAHEAAQRG